MEEIKLLNGNRIEIYEDCLVQYQAEDETKEFISITDLYQLLTPFKLSSLFNWKRECYDLIGVIISDLENFCEASFRAGFNPLKQLREKFRKYNWVFAYENPGILRENNVFTVLLDSENRICRILIPANSKKIIFQQIAGRFKK